MHPQQPTPATAMFEPEPVFLKKPYGLGIVAAAFHGGQVHTMIMPALDKNQDQGIHVLMETLCAADTKLLMLSPSVTILSTNDLYVIAIITTMLDK